MKFRFALVAAAAAAGLVSAAARGQDSSSSAPPREYTAPLYQRTQPSYVPQSVALSGPRVITDWEEGEQVPPGYHPSTRIRKGPVIAGSIVFGIFYLISTAVAAGATDANGHSTDGALWVPGIGPFIQMSGTTSALGNWALGVDGLAQSAGLALLIYGIASPRTVLVRNDLGLRVLPEANPGGGGLRLVASF
jgi:hypothetical protein